MKTALISLLLAFVTVMSNAQQQEGWNWPEDEEKKSVAMEKQAFYKVNMGLEEWNKALSALNWLYDNNPDLNPSIYIDGAKVVETLLENDLSSERQSRLEDSLLWMYDMRMKHFEEDAASTMDRKAYTAFKLYYKSPAKYGMVKELFEKAVELNGPMLSTFNVTPYMTLGKYYYQYRPEEIQPEEVLEIHETLSNILDEKLSAGMESKNKIEKEQNKIDALLSSIEGLLSCDFIENKLVPKLESNPEDLNIAKKIFSYSLKAKCSDQPYFTNAGELLYKNEPSFKLASALANKYMASGQPEKAIEYFSESLNLASSSVDKYEAYYGMANAYSKMNQKSKSREMALKAINEEPGANEPYNLIGNLYFTSFQKCTGGESKVKDRAVFIAAYDMYKKAGNSSQMQASKEQFPSIEEIFNEGYEKGDKIQVGCWINKTVSLDTRG